MDQNIKPIHPDDLIVWPDGTRCTRAELDEMRHRSDDFELIPAGSAKWEELMKEEQ